MNTTFVQGQPQSPLAIQAALPYVVITGDLQLVVTESDVARGPIIGRYSIETQEMQEPLQVYWGAEGQVCNRQARATDIAFEMHQAGRSELDLPGAGTGHGSVDEHCDRGVRPDPRDSRYLCSGVGFRLMLR